MKFPRHHGQLEIDYVCTLTTLLLIKGGTRDDAIQISDVSDSDVDDTEDTKELTVMEGSPLKVLGHLRYR